MPHSDKLLLECCGIQRPPEALWCELKELGICVFLTWVSAHLLVFSSVYHKKDLAPPIPKPFWGSAGLACLPSTAAPPPALCFLAWLSHHPAFLGSFHVSSALGRDRIGVSFIVILG